MKKAILILALLGFLIKGYSQTNSQTTIKVVNGHVVEVTPMVPEKQELLTNDQINAKYKDMRNKMKQIDLQMKRLITDSVQTMNSLEEYNSLYRKLGIAPPK